MLPKPWRNDVFNNGGPFTLGPGAPWVDGPPTLNYVPTPMRDLKGQKNLDLTKRICPTFY